MTGTTITQPRKPSLWRFPGIHAIVAGIVQSFIGYTFPLYWWAIFLRAILADLRWSAAVAGVGLSIGNASGFFGSIAGGLAVDRWGPRWMTMLFLSVMGVGFIGLAYIDAEWQYFVLYGIVIYFPYYGGLYRMSWTGVNRWWIDRRAVAIALVTLGGGMGAVVGPWGAELTQAYGWRTMMWVAGFFLIVVCGAVAWLYPSHLPERYGLHPDNISPEERRARAERAVARGRAADTRPPLVDMDLPTILRSRAFWMIIVFTMLTATMAPFITFQNVAMGAKGYSLTEAAAWAAVNQVMTYAGRLSVLFVGDWIARKTPVRLSFAAAYILYGLGTIIFALGTEPWHFAAWAVVYGYGFGFMVPWLGVLIGAYFGRTAFGGTYGIRTGLYAVPAVITPTLVGWLADINKGDWTLPYLFMASGAILGGIVLIFAYPPPQQPRERRW